MLCCNARLLPLFCWPLLFLLNRESERYLYVIYNKFIFTIGEATDESNMRILLYCSNPKNFVALFSVSTMIGGRIPL